MDPHANLARQRELAADLLSGIASGSANSTARLLAEHVQALDEWRLNGGFDPYIGLPEGPVTFSQLATLGRLINRSKPAGAVPIQLAPFDLPEGYIATEVGGITYGIDKEGRASS
jgi:hypothetical protein